MSKATVKKVREATRKAGGATLTKDNRSAALNKFFEVMQSQQINMQVKSFATLKTKQVQRYVDYLKEKGLMTRSIHNILSHIRRALEAVGRGHFADSAPMSNKALGVSGASRDGTHRALTAMQYKAAVTATRATKPGAASCMELQCELGLRAREAIQSIASLNVWLKAIKAGLPCQILHGTKNGRPRWIAVLDKARAIDVIERAIQVANAQHGFLIVAKNLKAAARAYGRACEAVGLKGEYASHCLRCTNAVDLYDMYMEMHGDRREALAALSAHLGHGDGRGTYAAQVYLKNAPRELPLP